MSASNFDSGSQYAGCLISFLPSLVSEAKAKPPMLEVSWSPDFIILFISDSSKSAKCLSIPTIFAERKSIEGLVCGI